MQAQRSNGNGHPTSDSYNLWSVSLTPFYLQSREEILQGRRFGSFGIGIRPEWERRSERIIHSAKLEVSFAQPKTNLEPVRAAVLLNLGLQYTFERIALSGRCGRFSVGGTAMFHYTIEYLPLWDDSHFFWTGFAGIGLRARWEKMVRGQNCLYARLDFPITGFLSRPPAIWEEKIADASIGNILSTINSDMQVVFVNRYTNPTIQIGYRVKQSDNFSIGFHYMVDYLSAKSGHSNPYVQLIQGIGLQLIF